MPSCKWCSRSGFFLSIDQHGLCASCRPGVYIEVSSRARVIGDCVRLIRDSKKLDIRVSRCDLLIQYLTDLLKFEKKGIPTLNTLPSVLLEQYVPMREELIILGLREEIADARRKNLVTVSTKSKIAQLSKVLMKIDEYRAISKDALAVMALHNDIEQQIQEIQMKSFLEDAQKYEFKGQKKKALDKYYEALYMLRHDDISDSEQGTLIENLESKIRELGGEVR